MLHLLFSTTLFLWLVSVVKNEELLVDQCYYDEIPNFSLQQVQEPSKTLKEFVGEEWLKERFDCYKKCCDDEFQIGTIGKCTAAAYYMNTNNQLVCQLLQCDPPEKCLWSPGTPGKFAGFIRNTKTTTTTQTTTTTTETTTKVPEILTSQQVATDINNTVVTGNDSHVAVQNASQPNAVSPEDEKPDTIHIEPIRRGHHVPTKGLVAGIVLAVLLVILLISFLTKQLKGMRQPVQYKPLNEEEYQKLTMGEDT